MLRHRQSELRLAFFVFRARRVRRRRESSSGMAGEVAEQVEIETRIRALLAPIVEEMEAEVLRVSLGGGGGSQLLRVLVDRRGGLGVDELERISRALSLQLDAEDPIAGSYRLEVSSPGLDWPLERLADFRRYAGALLRVELPDGRHAEGRLQQAREENGEVVFTIMEEGGRGKARQGREREFRLDETARVTRAIDWRAVSRRRRGQPPE